MISDQAYKRNAAAQWLCLVSVLLVLGRVLSLLISPLELYADEAQYWRWGQDFDWGYYSKPPMIGWVIGGITSVFGDSEWAIRLAAPILHGLAGYCLCRLGTSMREPLAGALAMLGYLMMPGVIVSSAVISTDGVLLPFFSLALWRAWEFRERVDWLSTVILGLAIGVGFLAKYAMMFFAIGIILSLVFDEASRGAWLSKKGCVVLLIALVILMPHLWWNYSHGFETVSHTVDNANLGGPLFNPENLIKFILDQMGVFGPISFIFFVLGAIILWSKSELNEPLGWLLFFCIPVLLIIGGQSILSRAHANWAATAYPAASVFVVLSLFRFERVRILWGLIISLTVLGFLFAPNLTTHVRLAVAFSIGLVLIGAAFLSELRPWGLFWTGLGLHALIALSVPILMILPGTQADALGLSNALKRVRGWEDTSGAVFAKAEAINATAILVDEREVWHALDYYGEQLSDIPLYSWRRYGQPKSYAEKKPMPHGSDDIILIASYRPGLRPMIRSEFKYMHFLGSYTKNLGNRSNGCPIYRRIVFYVARGHTPNPNPETFESEFEDMEEYANPKCTVQN